jgi:tetratricopeptide (TPR) repeat protein
VPTLDPEQWRALAAGKPEQALADADRLLSMEQSSNQQGALSAKAGNAYLARARALQAMGRHNEARAAAPVAVERVKDPQVLTTRKPKAPGNWQLLLPKMASPLEVFSQRLSSFPAPSRYLQ